MDRRKSARGAMRVLSASATFNAPGRQPGPRTPVPRATGMLARLAGYVPERPH